MNPMKPRRARIGVESLEGRKLTALFDAFLEIEAFDVASPSRPAEVQVRRTDSAAAQRPVRRGRGRPRPVADGGPFIHTSNCVISRIDVTVPRNAVDIAIR
jgi:hypothetical protein